MTVKKQTCTYNEYEMYVDCGIVQTFLNQINWRECKKSAVESFTFMQCKGLSIGFLGMGGKQEAVCKQEQIDIVMLE